jgi:outer membrane receptor protein involved in Fe transport
LAADMSHPLPKAIPVIPIGAGIRYGITPALSVTAEASYRVTFTDYLDGFSQVANPNKDDRYYSWSIGLVYKFISSDILRCPVMRL